MNSNFDIIIVGGGAAGFFTAVNSAEKNPNLKIAILERGKEVLTKVKISGGGRCNVTHACFVPNELVKNYPRGEKELKGPFNTFCSGDTIEWFGKRGVPLKIEDDGRMFPVSDSSQTIIDCFLSEIKKYGIQVLTNQSVQSIYKAENYWKVETNNENFVCEKLVMTTGSNPKIWEMLAQINHTVVAAVPSLFTFNITDKRIKDLMGLSAHATIKIKNSKLQSSGPLLITHWGLSGPAILKLSAWGALELAAKKYQFAIEVNWLHDIDLPDAIDLLKELKLEHAKKAVSKKCLFELPNRLWENLVIAANIAAETKWADLNKNQMQFLANQLTKCEF
ncbi:MAG: aminoacetone oxidase family FAD-binding enzyme, partial [Flavobacterium sp.]|nr:aminoacetone oxidase family FAD-binding enzyme [Flavobacterium sp.]